MNQPLRILLVEDEALLSLSLKMELRRQGYSVTDSVATGEEAIESAWKDPPDVILMDIRLAGDLDGIDAASAIRARAAIPILFMSAFEDEPTRARAQTLCPVAFLNKPFRTDQLRTILETGLA